MARYSRIGIKARAHGRNPLQTGQASGFVADAAAVALAGYGLDMDAEPTRRQVLAHRLTRQGLLGTSAPGILGIGLQDTPAGSARIGLRARALPDKDLVLALTIRGAPHLHRRGDLAFLRAVLMPQDNDELATWLGGYGPEIRSSDVDGPALVRQVAEVMRSVLPTVGASKGELSGLVSPELPDIARPWCEGCGVRHVQEGLFRLGTLMAVAELDPDSGNRLRFVPGSGGRAAKVDRADLVRAFLRFMGPLRPADVTGWLSTLPHPAGAALSTKLWDAVAGELTEIKVDGRKRWVLGEFTDSEPEPSLLLLPPRDPYILGEHSLLVPDKAKARQVWKPVGSPGVLVVDGEIQGIWRQRLSGKRLKLEMTYFEKLPAKRTKELRQRAEGVASARGAEDVEIG
jgi:hypothetical protein